MREDWRRWRGELAGRVERLRSMRRGHTFDPATGKFYAGRAGEGRRQPHHDSRAWSTAFFNVARLNAASMSRSSRIRWRKARPARSSISTSRWRNPGATNAPVEHRSAAAGRNAGDDPNVVTANTPLQLRVDNLMPDAAVSTIVPLDERAAAGGGADDELGCARLWRSWRRRGRVRRRGWLFAEGAQGFFKTFILLANDNAAPVDVTVKFLLEGGGVVTQPVTVQPQVAVHAVAGDVAQIVDRSFGLDITATAPIIAERAMYLPMGTTRMFDGGHESAGVNATSTRWFLAEGATGPFFDCFVLLEQSERAPSARDGDVSAAGRHRRSRRTFTMPANSRQTINVEDRRHRCSQNAAVSTTVTSDAAGSWPSARCTGRTISEGWREAHNSFGVTDSGAALGRRRRPPRRRADYRRLHPAGESESGAGGSAGALPEGRASRSSRNYRLPPTSRLNDARGRRRAGAGRGRVQR